MEKPVISKDDSFRIGMNLHKITMYVNDSTLKAIKPWLTEIENIVYKYTEAGQKEAEIRWTDKVWLDSNGNLQSMDGCPTDRMKGGGKND